MLTWQSEAPPILERIRAEIEGRLPEALITPAEVAKHNRADDLWVSSYGKVYNLTALVAENPGHLVQPIIDAAGTDISHWFDPVTKTVKTWIDPETEFETPFTPMGVFLHCPPPTPTAYSCRRARELALSRRTALRS